MQCIKMGKMARVLLGGYEKSGYDLSPFADDGHIG